MRRLLLFVVIAALSVASANAQDDEYKKGEFFIGYSNSQVETGLGDIDDDLDLDLDLDDRESFHGFNTSGVYNVSRYFGLKADFSAAYNNRGFAFNVPTTGGGTGSIAFETKNSLYNFLGGVQIKNNSKSGRFKPFAHALVGGAHARTKISGLGCSVGVPCTGIESASETNWAAAFGGGVDVRLTNRVQIRLIQFDYNPIFFNDGKQDNLRFGFGFVF